MVLLQVPSDVLIRVNIPLPHNITIDMKTVQNVNGLIYTPRQDGNSNGNIGQHQIQLSLDGVTFGAPVAAGTYSDDSSTKSTFFSTTPARFVRLIATTEAGGRGPWTSAADITMSAGTTVAGSPATQGVWSQTIDFPIVPVAAAVLPGTGNVLTWSAYAGDQFGGSPGTLTQTSTYDMTTGLVSQRAVSNTQHDMFCPGLSMSLNGQPFVTGGNSASRLSIYTPGSDSWAAGPTMNIARGYQASATLSDGRIFVIGGSWNGGQGNKNGEVYSFTSNTWSLLSGAPVAPMLTADNSGVYRADNHGWLFGWKQGSVFQAGPSKAMNWYTTAGAGSTTPAGARGTDADAMCGNAVMYDAVAGKILAAGGSANYDNGPARNSANVITIGAPNMPATVTPIASMAFARAFANGVALPNGQVLIVGGQTIPAPFSDANAIFIAELWDPKTNLFTQVAPIASPRVYHSVGLLLIDGTVFNGGGGLCAPCTTNHFDAQIWQPPYLFNADGSKATRPVINSISTATVVVGGKITVAMNAAVSSFALMRHGATTHTVNTDQRRIPLTPTVAGLSYTVTVPADPGVALPGYWMLFAINAAGVPSVAKSVLVKGA